MNQAPPGERHRVLFVTSNGTGLGHLTRTMAIARRLDERFQPLILTLSGGESRGAYQAGILSAWKDIFRQNGNIEITR